MNWDWHFVFEVICQFVMHEKSLETFINELGLTLCIWSYMSVCYQWNYLMLLVAYKKKRRRRKIGETEKENKQLSDFWQLPMSAVTTYLLYPNRQIPQVLGRYTFLIITKHLAKCASYWQMTILKWFVLCEWRNAPAMITSASNMADQQHEPVFVTACVCHSLCLSLPVFVTSCVCHSLCLSLPVFVTACVCHCLCLSLLVLVTACACHSLSASFVSHFARHYLYPCGSEKSHRGRLHSMDPKNKRSLEDSPQKGRIWR